MNPVICKSVDELLSIKTILIQANLKGGEISKKIIKSKDAKKSALSIAIYALGTTANNYLRTDVLETIASRLTIYYGMRALSLVQYTGKLLQGLGGAQLYLHSGEANAATLTDHFAQWENLGDLLSLDDKSFLMFVAQSRQANINVIVAKQMYDDILSKK